MIETNYSSVLLNNNFIDGIVHFGSSILCYVTAFRRRENV